MLEHEESLVSFKDFFVIPNWFYKMLGMFPYVLQDESTTTKSILQTKIVKFLLFSTAFLNINISLWLEILDMSKATILGLIAVWSCFVFTVLAELKILIIWRNRDNVNNMIRLKKRQFPKTSKQQKAFDVDNNLKSIVGLEKVYFTVSPIGLWSFNLLSLVWSTIEYLLNTSNGFVKRYPYWKKYPFKVDSMWTYFSVYVQQIHIGLAATDCFMSADIFIFISSSISDIQRELGITMLHGTNEDLVKLKYLMNFHRTTLQMSDLTSIIFSTTILLNFLSSIMII